MLEKVYQLLEIVSILICLHSFNGKKLKIDISSAGYIVLELTLMQLMQDRIISQKIYFAVYFIFFIYAYIKFSDTIKQTIFKCLLSILTVGILQMIVYIPICFTYYMIPNESVVILLINLIVFITIFITRNISTYKWIVDLGMNREWIVEVCVSICIVMMLYCMYSLKNSTVIKMDIFVLMSIFITLILLIIYRWQKATYEIAKREKEMQIANMYNGAFYDLIDTIRDRQHEFNNQIDAIYSMHLTAKSMEELIELQGAYCDEIVLNNRLSKVLNGINNPTLSGFIYTKLTEAEEKGIYIDYNVFYTGKNMPILLCDLIEIVGILIDNAIEAVLLNQVDKNIIFEMKDNEDKFEISVKNPVISLSNNDIAKFFTKGYSTKGQERGIGLSKLKSFQKKYKYDILVHTYEENDKEWIEFNIIEKK